jgi:hypothetical protein
MIWSSLPLHPLKPRDVPLCRSSSVVPFESCREWRSCASSGRGLRTRHSPSGAAGLVCTLWEAAAMVRTLPAPRPSAQYASTTRSATSGSRVRLCARRATTSGSWAGEAGCTRSAGGAGAATARRARRARRMDNATLLAPAQISASRERDSRTAATSRGRTCGTRPATGCRRRARAWRPR